MVTHEYPRVHATLVTWTRGFGVERGLENAEILCKFEVVPQKQFLSIVANHLKSGFYTVN